MGAIQPRLDGSAGREGKYVAWSFVRKAGSVGSSSGAGARLGKCIFVDGGRGWIDETGCRSAGG